MKSNCLVECVLACSWLITILSIRRARGTNHENSDCDVRILPSDQFTFGDYCYLENELSNALNAEVRIVTRKTLDSHYKSFRRNVIDDEALAYG